MNQMTLRIVFFFFFEEMKAVVGKTGGSPRRDGICKLM